VSDRIDTTGGGRRWWQRILPAGPGEHSRTPSGAPGVADVWAGLTPDLGLRMIGLSLTLSCPVLAVLIGFGISDTPSDPERAVLVLLAGTAIGIGLIFAGVRKAPSWTMHFGPWFSFAILYLTISTMGEAEPRLVMGYATVLVWVALFLSPRALIGYSIVVLAIFAGTWIRHSDDPIAGVPIFVASILMITICAVTLLAREHLDRVTQNAQTLSGRDPLTGLSNQGPLYEKLEMLIQKAEREKTDVSVLLIELDDFKQINDRYSRSTGDRTLQEVAKTLGNVVRRNELAARRGGAEFAIVTESADRHEIESLIERLSGEIAIARLDVCPDGPAGITVGVATCRPGDTVARMLSRADRALRDARGGVGGGRVLDDEEV
jgi:diguanylate cyclase (GGDEF)-like protein